MKALLTDLYELNMAASYLRRKMTGPATFGLFVRRLPPKRGFLVVAGVETCLDALEGFAFEEQDLAYLRHLGFSSRDVEAFRRLRFTGDVWAVPEGRIAFAEEPLLEVTAPIAEAQLIETYLLNRITFETSIASKAARCTIAARGRDLIDFSFRRTQGIEAGLDVARLTAMVGFSATSNVEAARQFGLTPAGTMAHSYIEAFPSEKDAFRAFAEDFPHRVTFLVDTFDTLSGVRRAAEIIRERGLSGGLGIRLDSGDLGHLARRARTFLDRYGLPHVRILASGGLDELQIDELLKGGAPIDAFGVGTKMGVSADCPYLDTAYKLVCFGGRPIMKLSPGKVSPPGRKQVFRTFREDGSLQDQIGLRDEPVPPGRERLLEPVMIGGRRNGVRPSLETRRQRFEADLARLPEAVRNPREPQPPRVLRSRALSALTIATRRAAESASR